MTIKENLKTYHGLSKSLTDKNTILYASFDKKLDPEIGFCSVDPTCSYEFSPMPTGYGLKLNSLGYYRLTCSDSITLEKGTIDFWINPSQFKDENDWSIPISLLDSNGKDIIFVCFNKGLKNLYVQENYSNGSALTTNSKNCLILDYNEKHRHIRICWDNSYIYMYSNGVLVGDKINRFSESLRITPSRVFGISRLTEANSFKSAISDLHVSNINRGDCFNNLPKDFIEKKAVIKTRMGQQQIKGDPLYSQVTTDIISVDKSKNKPYINCSRISGNWTSGDIIKIKGLNKELLGGVVDSDTALCKITKIFVNSATSIKFKVDSASKLVVDDHVNISNESMSYSWVGVYGIIESVDYSTSTVTLKKSNNSGVSVTVGDRLFEITKSTSSPVIESSDGKTVNGLWTNLGTEELTFTLSANECLGNKDLYVTYSINIPPSNSDFDEMPYEIKHVYDERGNELERVSSLTIEDDYMGKISGRLQECPHTFKHGGSTSELPNPQSNNLSEISTARYNQLSKLDGITRDYGTGLVSERTPVFLLSFDLIKIVENKIGKIPYRDKIQWIKDNVSATAEVHGFGTCSSGNKIYLDYYESSAWKNTSTSQSHSNSKHSLLSASPSSTSNAVDSNGYVHFLIRTDLSDGVTESFVSVDYARIKLTLKSDSSFSIFYTTNSRSRDCFCNPILIQKETKTIQRYLPSEQHFITEVSYSNPNPTEVGIDTQEILYRLPIIYLTTQGTGSYNPILSDLYRECVSRLGIPASKNSHLYLNEILAEHSDILSDYCPLRFVASLSDSYYSNNHSTLPINKSFETMSRCLAIKPYIAKSGNELVLLVAVREFSYGVVKLSKCYNYKLPNRPLIK